jgi:hypothetical protein
VNERKLQQHENKRLISIWNQNNNDRVKIFDEDSKVFNHTEEICKDEKCSEMEGKNPRRYGPVISFVGKFLEEAIKSSSLYESKNEEYITNQIIITIQH